MIRYDAAMVDRLIGGALGMDAIRQQAAARGIRLDAIDSAFIARELNAVIARTYDVKYAELKGRKFVAKGGNVPMGATTFSYKQYGLFGKAKLGGSLATDIPVAGATAQEFEGRVVPITTSYVYTLLDLLAAQFSQMPLDRTYATGARRAFEEQLDDVIATGSDEFKFKGLLNQPNALTFTIPEGEGDDADATWATKTGEEMYKDLAGLVSYMITQTKETEHPNQIILPTEQYALADSTPWNSANPTDLSVLGYFRKSHPDIAVDSWIKCAGAGTANTDRAVAYRRDEEHIFLVLPMDFQQQPMQQENFAYKTPCIGTTGGVVTPYPKSIVYGDGI